MKKRFFSKIFVVAAMCLSFAAKGFSQAGIYILAHNIDKNYGGGKWKF